MATCSTPSSSMDVDRDELQSSDTGPKSSDVVAGVESDLQHASPPDPRWPYLGRWSANQKPASPTLPLSSVKESEADAPSATFAHPPATTDPPPAFVIKDPPPAYEIMDIPHASVTIDLPPASAPLTDGLIDVNEVVLPLVPTGLDEVSQKGDLDEETAKETVFVRSMGAWSKPLLFPLRLLLLNLLLLSSVSQRQ
ncbi:hypothetical protein Bca4012_042388 [Brassica carinata]